MVKIRNLIQCTKIGPIGQHTRTKFEVDTSRGSRVMAIYVKKYMLTDRRKTELDRLYTYLTFFACFDLRNNTLKYPLRILKHSVYDESGFEPVSPIWNFGQSENYSFYTLITSYSIIFASTVNFL
jgi:hypothetical protein